MSFFPRGKSLPSLGEQEEGIMRLRLLKVVGLVAACLHIAAFGGLGRSW